MDRAATRDGFERNEQRRLWSGGVAFVTSTLGGLIGLLMSQSVNGSPLQCCRAFILAIVGHAMAQPEFLPQEYKNYEALVVRGNKLLGALAVVSLVQILDPGAGAFLLVLWLCWFTRQAIGVYQEFHGDVRRIALRLVGRGTEEQQTPEASSARLPV